METGKDHEQRQKIKTWVADLKRVKPPHRDEILLELLVLYSEINWRWAAHPRHPAYDQMPDGIKASPGRCRILQADLAALKLVRRKLRDDNSLIALKNAVQVIESTRAREVAARDKYSLAALRWDRDCAKRTLATLREILGRTYPDDEAERLARKGLAAAGVKKRTYKPVNPETEWLENYFAANWDLITDRLHEHDEGEVALARKKFLDGFSKACRKPLTTQQRQKILWRLRIYQTTPRSLTRRLILFTKGKSGL